MWAFQSTIGRVFGKSSSPDVEIVVDDEDSDVPERTPSDSAGEDFEMLDKSTDSLNKAAKATGAQQGGKPNKRRGKKR